MNTNVLYTCGFTVRSKIRRGAEEPLDTQVLFDPLEEQLHLPATLVEVTDGQRIQVDTVKVELGGIGTVNAR